MNYVAGVHQSLIQPVMIAGVPRGVFWINIFVMLECIYIGAWWLIGVSAIVHYLAKVLCKRDPEFFNVAIQQFRDKDQYLGD